MNTANLAKEAGKQSLSITQINDQQNANQIILSQEAKISDENYIAKEEIDYKLEYSQLKITVKELSLSLKNSVSLAKALITVVKEKDALFEERNQLKVKLAEIMQLAERNKEMQDLIEELDHLKARVAAYESVFEDEEFISKEDM